MRVAKAVQITAHDGAFSRATPANPFYDPFDIDLAHDFEVLGKVIRAWCWTDY